MQRGRLLLTVCALGLLVTGCGSSDDDSSSGTQPAVTTTTAPAASTTVAASDALEWTRLQLGIASTYVLVRGDDVTIVDPGSAGTEVKLEPQLKKLGFEWSDVDHVVTTHRHGDHTGAFDAVLKAAPQAKGYAGTDDVEAITTARPLEGVGDGDAVMGLKVIETPGHTPGSISLLDEDTGVLIVGDAFNREGAAISGPRPEFTADLAQAHASLRKLTTFEFETILFGHVDPVEQNGEQLLAAYVATL